MYTLAVVIIISIIIFIASFILGAIALSIYCIFICRNIPVYPDNIDHHGNNHPSINMDDGYDLDAIK